MKRTAPLGFLLVVAAWASGASAQWIHVPLPGTPRLKDGKADLSAPAPKTAAGNPDFTGIWVYSPPRRTPPQPGAAASPPQAVNPAVPNPATPGRLNNILRKGDEIVFQPWAEALYKQRIENNGVGLPSEHCLPHGPPGGPMIQIPFKILQTPNELAILFEEFNYYRQLLTDGRSLPAQMNPTWYGYSVGKWDGDALVVETAGYNDLTWLDVSGYPHSEELRTTERLTRPDFGHLQNEMTIDDPKAYKKPFTLILHFQLQPDTELIEEVCDNERDARHMVGK